MSDTHQPANSEPNRRQLESEERRRLDRHSWELIDRLKRESDVELRQAYYRQLEATFAELGIAAPALSAIGLEAPEQPPAATAFWHAFATLEAAGVRVNHHRDPSACAVNLQQFYRDAATHGLKLPTLPVIKHALRRSVSPTYLGQRKVNSAIILRALHCWVFDAPPSGDTSDRS